MKYLFLQYLSICLQWYVCFGYLCISRSNFVNASQEKFSPVSKVLHRIQNKFPGSQSATLSHPSYILSSLLCNILQINVGEISLFFVFEYFAFGWFWSQQQLAAFCRRSWNGFPLIYDQGLPRPRLPNSPLNAERLKSFRQKLPPSSLCAKHWFTYCVYSLCNGFHLIYDGSSQNSL